MKVPLKDVRVGDIFQGKRDGSKWYENTDPNQKQVRHVYWRLRVAKKAPARKPAKKKPVKKAVKRKPARKR